MLLPEFYNHLVSPEFEGRLPQEKLATCDDCAMCTRADKSSESKLVFMPDKKCCTYHPKLPNFSVGAILSDPSAEAAEGRKRILQKISNQVSISPLGISRPADYEVLYGAGQGFFGQSEALLCPYYIRERGQCSIWRYREAVCATWYCKYENGQDGMNVWQAIRMHLQHLQKLLSGYAMSELGFSVDPSAFYPDSQHTDSKLQSSEIDGTKPDPKFYNNLWKDWSGREEEYYVACYEIVKSLSASEISKMGGLLLSIYEKKLGDAFRSMEEDLPQYLACNPKMTISRNDDGQYILTTYNVFDPRAVSEEVFRAIWEFDGKRSVAQTMEALQEKYGFTVSHGLLRRLFESRILIAR